MPEGFDDAQRYGIIENRKKYSQSSLTCTSSAAGPMSTSCMAAAGSTLTPTRMPPWGGVTPPFLGSATRGWRQCACTNVALLPSACEMQTFLCTGMWQSNTMMLTATLCVYAVHAAAHQSRILFLTSIVKGSSGACQLSVSQLVD